MTSVTVYAVLEDGATSEEVFGTGQLADPQIVLADEDLRQRLTALIPTEARFRVSLAAAVDGQVIVEVIDAQELHSVENESHIVLSLRYPSKLPPDGGHHRWNWCNVLSPPPWWC